jgi:hypothetical protein
MQGQVQRNVKEAVEKAQRAAADRVRVFKVGQGELEILHSELRDTKNAVEALKDPRPDFSAEIARRRQQ